MLWIGCFLVLVVQNHCWFTVFFWCQYSSESFQYFVLHNFFLVKWPIHNTKELAMNVTLIKSVAKLFHIILYTYSVKTNLNFCESFYFDYHLRELKGFHSLLLFWNTTWEIYTEHNPLQGPHTDTLYCNCVRRYQTQKH